MAIVNYLIAFSGKPQPTFMTQLRHLAEQDGVHIIGMKGAPGPGCYNLGIRMAENSEFISQLTIALMPAKWTTTIDHIEDDTFVMEA